MTETIPNDAKIFAPEVIELLISSVGYDGLVELLQMLPQEISSLRADLTSAVEQGNTGEVRWARHTLKGLAANLGAVGIVEALDLWGRDVAAGGDGTAALARVAEAVTLAEAETWRLIAACNAILETQQKTG